MGYVEKNMCGLFGHSFQIVCQSNVLSVTTVIAPQSRRVSNIPFSLYVAFPTYLSSRMRCHTISNKHTICILVHRMCYCILCTTQGESPMNKIKEFRTQLGLTQKDLATLMDTTQQTIGRWENGTSEPSLSKLRDLAFRLGTTTSALLGEPFMFETLNDKPWVRDQSNCSDHWKWSLYHESPLGRALCC